MSQKNVSPRRRSSRLSVRISLWLIAAAMLPLLAALVISEMQTRNTLTNQANKTLESDIQTHSQLLNNYLQAKMLEEKTLDNTPVVLQYFADPADNQAALTTLIQNGLAINKSNDPDVLLVTHYDLQGHYLFHYSIYGLNPTPAQQTLPPEIMQNVLQSKTLQYVSDAQYDPATRQYLIDIYTTVYSFQLAKPLAIIRSTLSLNNVWSIINSETGVNGDGSYAFIVDENGVRIVDPNKQSLFTAVAPLNAQQQQAVADEGLYGSTNGNVRVLADSKLNSIKNAHQTSATFLDTPVGKTGVFQVDARKLTVVPWTYYVVAPQSSIYLVANQQLLIIAVIALIILIPAIVVGWIIGSNISRPISRSVESLQKSSYSLNQLAKEEKALAAEPIWMAESSEIGLKSIQYYTNASKIAARRLNELGNDLLSRPDQDKQSILQGVAQMVEIGQYFERATDHQAESNAKVAVAIRVTGDAAKQIEVGAKSVDESASVLNQVVTQLRRIIGG
jgi:nitrogen fixation/metabolism regulation signal transduction histidine kinase